MEKWGNDNSRNNSSRKPEIKQEIKPKTLDTMSFKKQVNTHV